MNKLIRAEWYRLRHSGNYFKFFVFLSFTVIASTLLHDFEIYQKTLSENIICSMTNISLLMPMFIGTLISVFIGVYYHNRTAYYEVMDGNSISNIILSKVVVYLGMIFCLFVIPMIMYYGGVGIANGVGNLKNILLFFILFVTIIVHVVSAYVLLSLCFKNLIVGIIGSYIRFLMLEGVIMFAFEQFFKDSKFMEKIFCWSIMNQFTRLADKNYDGYFIFVVFASFIIEFALLYIIAYKGFKNRNFKQ